LGLIKNPLMTMEYANSQLPFILALPEFVSARPKGDSMELSTLKGSSPVKVCFV